MTDLLIASHDQAVHAIREHVNQDGVDELLRGVVLTVVEVHPSYPSPTGKPEPDCWSCEGKGWFEREGTVCDGLLARVEMVREHCHCRCPWCSGCDEPLCDGPCPTVEAIAHRLDLIPAELPEGDTRP
ncbi:hypothetical protein ACWER9_06620 [Micromonospora sp. NPDC003944]